MEFINYLRIQECYFQQSHEINSQFMIFASFNPIIHIDTFFKDLFNY
jgi:hypothetical protein